MDFPKYLGRGPIEGNGRNRRDCFECACGTRFTARRRDVRVGKVKSCGCHKKMLAFNMNNKGGRKKHPLYNTWILMRRRCNDFSHKDFANWGARGIAVCEEWDRDFEAFVADMGERPKGHTLDRIDNDGPYCKENCRWADASTQNKNRRRAVGCNRIK